MVYHLFSAFVGYIILCYVILCYIILYCIVLCCIVLYCIVLYCIILYYIILYYIILYYIILYYITLHYITLHYITLHYITNTNILLHFEHKNDVIIIQFKLHRATCMRFVAINKSLTMIVTLLLCTGICTSKHTQNLLFA